MESRSIWVPFEFFEAANDASICMALSCFNSKDKHFKTSKAVSYQQDLLVVTGGGFGDFGTDYLNAYRIIPTELYHGVTIMKPPYKMIPHNEDEIDIGGGEIRTRGDCRGFEFIVNGRLYVVAESVRLRPLLSPSVLDVADSEVKAHFGSLSQPDNFYREQMYGYRTYAGVPGARKKGAYKTLFYLLGRNGNQLREFKFFSAESLRESISQLRESINAGSTETTPRQASLF
tara:strand:- start:115781 stop:116473 length:693 start_codon:yes stop_codon:yes gene_type:complete